MFNYYKDEEGLVYCYTEDQPVLEGLIAISEEEKDEILAQREMDRFNSLSYAIKRRRAYPPMEEYLDAIVKGDQAQLENYIQKCLEVKSLYPKQ